MEYTTSLKKGTYEIPHGQFDNNGNLVYNECEHYDIDVLEVSMQSKINSKEDMKNFAEALYPEIMSTLGDNKFVGVRVLLDRPIKTVLSQDTTVKAFQSVMLREFGAMELDAKYFGAGKENN